MGHLQQTRKFKIILKDFTCMIELYGEVSMDCMARIRIGFGGAM